MKYAGLHKLYLIVLVLRSALRLCFSVGSYEASRVKPRLSVLTTSSLVVVALNSNDPSVSLKRHDNAQSRNVSGRVAWSSPKRWSSSAASWSEQVYTIAWPSVGCFVPSVCLLGYLFCQIRPQLPRILLRTNVVPDWSLKGFEFASASLSLVEIVAISRRRHRIWWSEHGERRYK